MKINKGKRKRPRKAVVYGVPGVGKSKFASEADNAIFLPVEDGISDLDVSYFDRPLSFDDCLSAVTSLCEQEHDYRWFVIDTADWLERLCQLKACEDYGKESIEEVLGGFGKGYGIACGHFKRFLNCCDYLVEDKGVNVLFLAHAKIHRFEDPEHEGYDRYEPKLHKQVCALLTEWCDELLFANFKKHTKQTDAGFSKKIAKAVGSGERVLRTNSKPAAEAKNRLGMEDEIPFAWANYQYYLDQR